MARLEHGHLGIFHESERATAHARFGESLRRYLGIGVLIEPWAKMSIRAKAERVAACRMSGPVIALPLRATTRRRVMSRARRGADFSSEAALPGLSF